MGAVSENPQLSKTLSSRAQQRTPAFSTKPSTVGFSPANPGESHTS